MYIAPGQGQSQNKICQFNHWCKFFPLHGIVTDFPIQLLEILIGQAVCLGEGL